MTTSTRQVLTGVPGQSERFDFFNGNQPSVILAGDGNDYLFSAAGDDYLVGGDGRDLFRAEQGNDIIYGDNVADGINGNQVGSFANQGDLILGGTDNDVIFSQSGFDYVNGEQGNDVIYGGLGNDFLQGGDGADIINGGDGDDFLYGGGTNAVPAAYLSPITVNYNGVNDTLLAAPETYDIGAGFIGSSDPSNDELYGGNGRDWLDGGAGSDLLVGGTGEDIASYTSATGTVNINLANQTGIGAEANGDVLMGIEDVYGSNFGDLIRGDSQDNVLVGFGGGDILIGEGGNDILSGGAGGDIMTGGAGNDIFVVRNEAGADTIVDFDQNGDDIVKFADFGPGFSVNNLQFTQAGGNSTLVTADGWAGSVLLQGTPFSAVGQDDFLFS